MSTRNKLNSLLGVAFYGILSAIVLAFLPSDLFCVVPKGITEGPAAIADVFRWMCGSKFEIAVFTGLTGLMALVLYSFINRRTED